MTIRTRLGVIRFKRGFAGAAFVLAVSVLGTYSARAQESVAPSGEGTEANPYQISQLGHLVWMGEHVEDSGGKHYALQNDIDASDTTNWNSGAGFDPIGRNDAAFTGVFDGNGMVISNLAIDRPSQNEVGLFGTMGYGAQVKNLALADATVTGDGYVGALVGWNNYGTLSNCAASGVLTGYTYAGGLVGYNNGGTVSVCHAAGLVTGFNIVGGLVGENGGAVSGCFAETVASGGDRVGGLVGANQGTVSGCSAAGAVSGDSYIGGLVGRNSLGTVSGSRATGSASGKGSVGGLVGYLYGSELSQCSATGAVTVSGTGWNAGGLVGYSTGSTIVECHATGPVTGYGTVGGLVGDNEGTPAGRCYATGNVMGSEYVGGLVGYNNGSMLGDCYAMGDVTGASDDVGGLVGFNRYITVARCYATGFVTGSTWSGGLVGGNNGTVLGSYWDTNTTGRTYSGGGSGRSTEEMKQQATFAGWDFDNVWAITEGVSYPFFAPPAPELKIIGVSGDLAFGGVYTGQTATAALTITNSGNTVLTVTDIAYPAGFSGDWSGSIEAGSAANVTVTFSPAAVQSYGGTVTVHSDSTGGGNTIEASGEGMAVPEPGQFCFAASAYSATEGVKRKVLVRRINGTSGPVSVDYVMKAKTALPGKDYTAHSGTLIWTNGQSASLAIKIPILADRKAEGNETFQILLKNPVGATLTAPAKTTVTILAN